MDRHAVIKFVNYKTPTLKRAQRLSRYIGQLARTEPKYLAGQYMLPPCSEHSLEVIENRYHPKGTRTFKQGILSFGASTEELPPNTALDLTKEVLAFFTDYPWLAAIHTNKPKHIHAHFLLGMTNVRNGKKYSQSPQELHQFMDHYNDLARKHSLPQLKGSSTPDGPLSHDISCTRATHTTDLVNWVDFDEQQPPTYCSPQPVVPRTETHLEVAPANDPLRVIGDQFRKDFSNYFFLGYTKGRL